MDGINASRDALDEHQRDTRDTLHQRDTNVIFARLKRACERTPPMDHHCKYKKRDASRTLSCHQPGWDTDKNYLRSIKVKSPTFSGSLDPEYFVDWVKFLDRYFNLYEIFDTRNIQFTTMKLTDPVNQYLSKVEMLKHIIWELTTKIWTKMPAKLKEEITPLSYYTEMLDKWICATKETNSWETTLAYSMNIWYNAMWSKWEPYATPPQVPSTTAQTS